MKRVQALTLLGSAALAGCGGGGTQAVAIGSKNFTEELIIGEIYALVLEQQGFKVDRKLNLGGTEIAQAALVRGDIDLYPEYTGTALIDVLKLPMQHDAAAIYDTVKSAYEQKFHLTWLDPAPFNDSQGLATTKAIAAKYNLKTLSDLSRAASQLRLGSIPEFIKRPDALPGLQKAYGGFVFKDIKLFDIGLKYKALLSGAVDVVVAFTTEGALSANDLVVFVDDKHFWPTYQVAPVIRQSTLKAMPAIATHLNKIAPNLTDATMRELNNMVDGTQKRDAADVAREFVKTHGLV
jgi:osmoprotectant transport system substrate-binding protein